MRTLLLVAKSSSERGGGDSPRFNIFSFSLFCYDIMGCSWCYIISKVALGFDLSLAIFFNSYSESYIHCSKHSSACAAVARMAGAFLSVSCRVTTSPVLSIPPPSTSSSPPSPFPRTPQLLVTLNSRHSIDLLPTRFKSSGITNYS
jgi:hypothetical protein